MAAWVHTHCSESESVTEWSPSQSYSIFESWKTATVEVCWSCTLFWLKLSKLQTDWAELYTGLTAMSVSLSSTIPPTESEWEHASILFSCPHWEGCWIILIFRKMSCRRVLQIIFFPANGFFFSMDHPNTDSAWNSSAAHDNWTTELC